MMDDGINDGPIFRVQLPWKSWFVKFFFCNVRNILLMSLFTLTFGKTTIL